MDVQIIIPHVGETTTRVKVIRWLKAEGEAVRKGEPLLEVETDKATLEIEAYADGVLTRVLLPEGSEADAFDAVGILEVTGDAQATPRLRGWEAKTPARGGEPARWRDQSVSEVQTTPVAKRLADEMGIDVSHVTGTGPGGRVTAQDVRGHGAARPEQAAAPGGPTSTRVAASPKARRLARELDIDLAGLRGTGAAGMITEADVREAAKAQAEFTEEPVRLKRLSRARQAIAVRMQQSKQMIPHFYVGLDVRMDAATRLRTHCVEALTWGEMPTFTDIIIRACALALSRLPEANVRLSDQGLEYRTSVDIGVAVAAEEGLLVPVLQSANCLDLHSLSVQVRALTERARSGRLRSNDLSPKSMVVSNLGMEGIDTFAAIIDPPDPMILAVGRVADRVVPLEGQPAILPMCTLTLSADHRVMDGVLAARFLTLVQSLLEQASELLGEGPTQ